MTKEELIEVTRIVREEVTELLRPVVADTELAIRGLQALCELHGINGKVRAAFLAWEDSRRVPRDADAVDEDTSPSVKISVERRQ